MIKVITGYKVKKEEDVQPLLLKLRSHATSYQGFVNSENLVANRDSSIIAVVMTWEKLENWKEWEKSSIRQSVMKEIREALLEEPRITVYNATLGRGWS